MTGKLPTQAELYEHDAEAAYQRLVRGERVSVADVPMGALSVLREKIAEGGYPSLHINGIGNQGWYTLALDPALRTGNFGKGPGQAQVPPVDLDQIEPHLEPKHVSEATQEEIDHRLIVSDLRKPAGALKGYTLEGAKAERLTRMQDIDPSRVDMFLRKYIEDNQGDIHIANMTAEERATHRDALMQELDLERDGKKWEAILEQVNNLDEMTREGQRYLREALQHGTEQFRNEMRAKYPEAYADATMPKGHKLERDEMDPTDLLNELSSDGAPPKAAPKPGG